MRQWWRAALGAALLVAGGCAFDRTGPPPAAEVGTGAIARDRPGWYERPIDVDGTRRWYRLYRPSAIADEPPLVIMLHGGSRSMRDSFGPRAGGPAAWLDVARDTGFLLAVPNGTNPKTGDTRGDNQFWNDPRPATDEAPSSRADDIAFIDALVERLLARYPVDPARVYVTGASNGGMMTYTLLMERPRRFAAGAAFIANLPQSERHMQAPAEPTPLLIANGTEDRLMKWEGGELIGGRGRMRSAEATVAWWVTANGARRDAASSRLLPDRDPDDDCRLREIRYPAGDGGAPVWFLRMEGGGHTVPTPTRELPNNLVAWRLFGNVCRDAEGARLAWDFLRRFRRPAD